MGDGAQSGKLANPATALGNFEISRKRKPVEWFEVVTEGNLKRLMPGFESVLSDRQRWDVTAFLYTLSYDKEGQAEGAAIYSAECRACHGMGGGDGIQAAELGLNQPDWLDPSRLVGFSADELMAVIANGSESGMPAFAEKLTAKQIQSVTGTIQTLGFTNQDTQEIVNANPGETAEDPTGSNQTGLANPTVMPADQEAGEYRFTIEGSVGNGSGGVQPGSGVVTLQGFDGMQSVISQTTELQGDGSYRFEDLQLPDNLIVVTAVKHEGLTYFSEFLPLSGYEEGDTVNLPIKVYDSTQDTSGLTADRLHVFLNFPQPDLVQVVQLFIISNTGSHVVAPASPGTAVLQFILPEEAQNLQFEEGILGERYVETENGFGETSAILPGDRPHQIIFAYEIPYDRKKTLNLQIPLDVEAALVALPAGQVKLQSSQLTDSGERNIDGTLVQMYTGRNMAKDSQLEITLSGKLAGEGAAKPGNMTNLAIGLGALGLSLILAGVWYARARPSDKAEEEVEDAGVVEESPGTIEALLDEIVALDDIYKAGELSDDAYVERRSTLKKRLKDVRASGKGE